MSNTRGTQNSCSMNLTCKLRLKKKLKQKTKLEKMLMDSINKRKQLQRQLTPTNYMMALPFRRVSHMQDTQNSCNKSLRNKTKQMKKPKEMIKRMKPTDFPPDSTNLLRQKKPQRPLTRMSCMKTLHCKPASGNQASMRSTMQIGRTMLNRRPRSLRNK